MRRTVIVVIVLTSALVWGFAHRGPLPSTARCDDQACYPLSTNSPTNPSMEAFQHKHPHGLRLKSIRQYRLDLNLEREPAFHLAAALPSTHTPDLL